MQDLSLLLLFIAILAGFLLGIISGLTPGIHVNNFALLLAASAVALGEYGIPPFYIAVMIVSNSITHTFLDIIPSIYLGAPEADTALAVLPGHRLLLEGKGMEAVRLCAIGSAGSVVASLLLVIPLALFFTNYYDFIEKFIGWILVAIVIVMIATERGEVIEGQGSLVHLKFKAFAAILFFLSGLLGVFAFGNQQLIDPLIDIGEASVLFPLLSGMFGASMLIISLLTSSVIPPQEKICRFRMPGKRILRGIFTGSAAGSAVAWLPGVSSSIATIIARMVFREKKGKNTVNDTPDDADRNADREFLIAVNGAGTANAIFSLVALLTIGKARSGAMVAIDSFMKINETSMVIVFMLVILIVSIASYYLTIFIGDRAAFFLGRINYSRLCAGVLVFLTVLIFLFTGIFGLLLFAISIPTGMFASYANIRKTHAMGVILLPVILFFFGF